MTETTVTDPAQQVGRCQHCQQVRPVFHYDRTYDNGEPIWDASVPEFLPTGAWLCARDWSTAETCRVNGLPFHVEHALEVWPWRAAKERLYVNGHEVLSESDVLLRECRAIAAATDAKAGA